MAGVTESGPGKENLSSLVTTLHYPPEAVRQKTRGIYETLLRESPHLKTGNFRALSSTDLARMFDLYDQDFFAGALHGALRQADSPLTFRLSPRMSRSGGHMARYRRRQPDEAGKRATRYELAIATALLFQTFNDVTRAVRVNGIECADRLEALQRVVEHEIIHLVELLVWDRSSCTAARFKALAVRVFAHTETTHNLVTQHERALANFAIGVGDRVTFVFQGTRYHGMVNRITNRATVLVENPDGLPYSDGKRYAKYYVPVAMLEKVQAPPPGPEG
jgi:hypothetical protein